MPAYQAIQDFGLVQEFCSKVPLWHISSRRTILGALLQDIMLRDIPQPILSRLLKPPLTATSEAGGGLDKTNKGKQPKGQAPGLMENVSVPKLTPDILVLLQIEVSTPVCAWPISILMFRKKCLVVTSGSRRIE